jgi:hypothetical protein
MADELFDRVIADAASKREARLAYDRAWREAHPDYNREWYEKKREARRVYMREWYLRRKARAQGEGEANPDRQGR